MKNETHRGSTKISMNLIKHTVHPKPTKVLITVIQNGVSKLNAQYVKGQKNLMRSCTEKLWMNPELTHKLTLNLK